MVVVSGSNKEVEGILLVVVENGSSMVSECEFEVVVVVTCRRRSEWVVVETCRHKSELVVVETCRRK